MIPSKCYGILPHFTNALLTIFIRRHALPRVHPGRCGPLTCLSLLRSFISRWGILIREHRVFFLACGVTANSVGSLWSFLRVFFVQVQYITYQRKCENMALLKYWAIGKNIVKRHFSPRWLILDIIRYKSDPPTELPNCVIK